MFWALEGPALVMVILKVALLPMFGAPPTKTLLKLTSALGALLLGAVLLLLLLLGSGVLLETLAVLLKVLGV